MGKGLSEKRNFSNLSNNSTSVLLENGALPQAKPLMNGTNAPNSDDTSSDKSLDAPLALWRKLAYGMGGPPMQMLSNCMGFFLTAFLLETAGVNAYYISVIQFTARAWDAITDPLAGYLVTRTRSRFGRLRPWLLTSMPFGCLTFFLLFYVPEFPSTEAKFIYYFAVVLLLQTSLTAFHVPYSSMTMLLTGNLKDRDLCSAYRMGFELIGVLLGVAVFGKIVNTNRVANFCSENYNATSITDEMRYKEKVGYMIGSGCLCGIFVACALIAFFGTKERDLILEKKENYFKSIKNILTYRPYLRLMFAFLFISLGIQVVQNNLVLYVTHSIQLSSHIIYGILVLLITAILVIPIAQLIIMRFGKKWAFASGILVFLPVQLSVIFLPPHPHLALYYGLMVFSGYTISIAFLLPWSMLPDVIDKFTLEFDVRKEAAFYSFYVFFNKFAVGISLSISSVVLGLVGYNMETCQQPESVGRALRYLMGPTSIVCCMMSLFFLYLYPINEEQRQKVQQGLLRKMLEKEGLDIADRSAMTLLSNSNGVTPVSEIPPQASTISLISSPLQNGHLMTTDT